MTTLRTGMAGAGSAPRGWLERLAASLAGAGPWQRALLAVGGGLLTAGALPPLYLLPLLIPAFTSLLWLMDGVENRRQAFALGWCFGLGFFVAGLYWIGIAMTVDLERFGWFMPVSVLGLSSGLSLFVGVAVWAVWASGARGIARVLFLAATWLAAEFARSLLLTGFPWNLLGSVWSLHPVTLQPAALFGVWGLGLLALVPAAAPAVLAGSGRAPERSGRRFVMLVWVLLLLAVAGGGLRLALAPAPGEEVEPDVWLRLVQPSIPQEEKWEGSLREQHLRTHAELSRRSASRAPTHLIWPETAVPWYLNREPALTEALGQLVPPGGTLIVGAPTYEAGASEDPRVYNSIYALDGAGETQLRYDKFHLVPFGEYLPFRGVLATLGMDKLTAGSLDFSRGPGAVTAELPGLPSASPLVCYEIIFSGRITDPEDARPAWLLNLTNDAWFGRSSGPWQHYASARLRAVEEGLPLVRAANNGVSAVVDPFGRVLVQLGMDAVGVADAPLPKPLRPTPYAMLGLGWVAVLLALLSLAVLLTWRGGRD